MNSKINIVFITDKNFVIQTYIAIMSLINTKNESSHYNIYVIAKDITPKQQTEFTNLKRNNVKITIVNSNIFVSTIRTDCADFPMVYWRLKLPDFFSNIDKILHLDCDIIVKKDLTELYNIDISNYYIGAVKDIAPSIYHAKIGKIYNNYFNAGIMLLNLDNIRKSNFFNNTLDYALKNGHKYLFKEQDILNDLIGNKLKIISTKYNFIASNKRYTNNQLKNFYGENIDDNEITIIHYAGKCRPWIYKYTYFAKEWNKILNKSIYSNYSFKRKHIPFLQIWVFIMAQYKILKDKQLYKKIGMI